MSGEMSQNAGGQDRTRASSERREGASDQPGAREQQVVTNLQDTIQSQASGGGLGGVSELPLRQFNLDRVADQLGLRTEDLVTALRSARDSAPTASAVLEGGTSVRYQMEQMGREREVPAYEGHFDIPESSQAEEEDASQQQLLQQQEPSQQQRGTMAIAFQPDDDRGNYEVRFQSDPSVNWQDTEGRGRSSSREKRIIKGQEGFAVPVRRSTTGQVSGSSRRSSLDRRTSIEERTSEPPSDEAELKQPLISETSYYRPGEEGVAAQTASLAAGAETEPDKRLPVLNIPHQEATNQGSNDEGTLLQRGFAQPPSPKGYLVGYPRAQDASQDDEGKEGDDGAKDYLFAVPKGAQSREAFWDNPLPSGLSEVNFDIAPVPGQDPDDPNKQLQFNVTVTKRTPLIGWILLVVSLLSVSITGFAIKSQKGPSSLMKCTWRSQATTLLALPFAFFFILKDRLLVKPFLRYQMWQAFLATMGYLIFNGTFLWALDHTSVAHGFLLNNLHSVLIVVFKGITGNPVQLLEALGSLVGLTGASLVSIDSQIHLKQEGKGDVSMAGDIVAAVGSIFGAMYFVCAKETRPKMNISVFAVICHSLNFPFFVAFTYLDAWIFSSSPWPTWDRDPSSGMFGWLTTKQLPSEALISIVSTMMGTTGYVLVMRYVEPLAISVVTLLEPVVATAIGIAAGVDTLPGSLTMFGAVLLLAGTIMVLRCERHRETRTDITSEAKKM